MTINTHQILFILFIYSSILFSQDNNFENKKIELNKLAQIILTGESDSIRIATNQNFKHTLLTVLNTKKSYKYDFGDIMHVSILQPKNKKFKLFTWFLPYNNGTYEYFGIIQKCKKNGKKCSIYELETTTKLEQKNLNEILNTTDWYGCIYYDIIPIKIEGKTYYTLLGWDGHNRHTTKKIIDVLSIPKKKNPFLGANIFNNKQKRIMIEYSSKYSVSLRYDKKLEYIVFDHVAPIDGISINNFDIYAPNLSYDIFKKTDFGWKLETDIYLNNTK